MSSNSPEGTPSLAAVQTRLHEIAQTLRSSDQVDPASRQVLAELVDELTRLLQSAPVPPEEIAHLAESTAHLAESLQHKHESGMLGKARERLEQALVNAETHAPLAAGIARRLLVTLSNLGI